MNTANDMDREAAVLAHSDMTVLDDLSGWLSAYHYEVEACGRKGELEREKCKSLARDAVKRLVNYL